MPRCKVLGSTAACEPWTLGCRPRALEREVRYHLAAVVRIHLVCMLEGRVVVWVGLEETVVRIITVFVAFFGRV